MPRSQSFNPSTVGGFSRKYLIIFVLALAGLSTPPAMAQDSNQVQQLIDAGQPQQALDMLSRLIRGKPTPEQRMLRGTARLMLGDLKSGSKDLEDALAQDPGLRQAWVNLGGLEIAEGNFQAAEKAFRQAYKLAPSQPDSHLNLGATLILNGKSTEARPHFDQYLQLEGGSGEAYYLVATNYALGNLEPEAVAALTEAIAKDERLRLRARRDDRFLALTGLDYRVLLNTDNYRPPAGYHKVQAAFRKPYDQQDGELLYAVLEALRKLNISYDPEVEAAARWAVVWGDVRIKLTNQGNGTGVVSLSVAPDQMSSESFDRLSQGLFQEIHRIVGQ